MFYLPNYEVCFVEKQNVTLTYEEIKKFVSDKIPFLSSLEAYYFHQSLLFSIGDKSKAKNIFFNISKKIGIFKEQWSEKIVNYTKYNVGPLNYMLQDISVFIEYLNKNINWLKKEFQYPTFKQWYHADQLLTFLKHLELNISSYRNKYIKSCIVDMRSWALHNEKNLLLDVIMRRPVKYDSLDPRIIINEFTGSIIEIKEGL